MVTNSANTLFGDVASFIPALLGALALVVLGVFVGKFFKFLTRKILVWSGFDRATVKAGLDDDLEKVGMKNGIAQAIGSIVYWIIFLVFITAAFETLGLTVVVETLNDLIAYLPRIIAAVIIMVLTVTFARFVRKMMKIALDKLHASYAQFVLGLAEALIIIFGATIALGQLNLNVSIVTNNITGIVFGFILICVLSIGVGSQTLSSNIMAGHYVRKMLKKDQKVTLLGVSGKVKDITSTAVILSGDNGDVVIPHGRIMKEGSLTK